MFINQDGTKNEEINAFLLTGDRFIGLNDNQFIQITPSGKRLEIWETWEDGRQFRVAYWHKNSLISFYHETEQAIELKEIHLQPQ